MTDNIKYYSEHAAMLIEQYNRVDFESVHGEWLTEIPEYGIALDVGAGSGRDAHYLSSRGLSVIAVEPAPGIRELASQHSIDRGIQWIDDRLPSLDRVVEFQIKFDLILLSAVWMHIAPEERALAINRLTYLLEEGGVLVITLRYGSFSDKRTAFPVSLSEVIRLTQAEGLRIVNIGERHSDLLGRVDIQWQMVCLRKDAIADAR